MYQLFYFTQFTLSLFAILVAMVTYLIKTSKQDDKDDLQEPPSPKALPIIGHMHLLGKYEIPYQAFTALREKYGDLIKLKLGFVNTLVVNGQKNIREVLVTKGHLFDSRPDFERYQKLFGGNKENCK